MPLYIPGNRIDILSGPNGVMPLDAALRRVMTAPFFPVELDEVATQLRPRELRANQPFSIGPVTCIAAKLNHPDPVYGYRLELGQRSIVYATRHRALRVRRSDAAQAGRRRRRPRLRRAVHAEEYPGKVGWGHSTWTAAVELARAAGVKQLVLFHHDPRRTDAQVADLEARARAAFPGTIAAREGMTLVAGDVGARVAA